MEIADPAGHARGKQPPADQIGQGVGGHPDQVSANAVDRVKLLMPDDAAADE